MPLREARDKRYPSATPPSAPRRASSEWFERTFDVMQRLEQESGLFRALPDSGAVFSFTPPPGYTGPPREGPCPCGSGRRLRSCHRPSADRQWRMNRPRPLLEGPRTGHAHPGCYARAMHDCDSRVTREHWGSRNVLDLIAHDGTVKVAGLPWLKGEEKRLTPGALGAKVLCERHNSSSSSLDRTSGNFFRVLLQFQEETGTTRVGQGSGTVAHGPVLRR